MAPALEWGMSAEPKTLQEAIAYFADLDNCLNYLAGRRWTEGVICPTCGSKDISFIASRRIWQCKSRHPKAQFSVKLGTIFEDSPLGLDKWLVVIWMLACNNYVSSYEVSRVTGITQKSCWYMLQRIHVALANENAWLAAEVPAGEALVHVKAAAKSSAGS